MSKRNKARDIWLDRYRSALVQACGAAAILGFTDHAATLCEMIDAARVDSRQQTGDKNALTRAQKCAIIKKGYQAACAPQNQKLQEGKKMMYTTTITSSRWVDGSGWSYTNCYAGFDDATIAEEQLDKTFSPEDFAQLIANVADDDTLHIWASDNGTDELYTYSLVDEDGNEVQHIELWESAIAKWMLDDDTELTVNDYWDIF